MNEIYVSRKPVGTKAFLLHLLIILVGSIDHGETARILGLFPLPSVSHQVVYRALTLELNKRGHELVVLTPNPINDPTLKNYTEIDISYLYEPRYHFSMNYIKLRNQMSTIQFYKIFHSIAEQELDIIYQNPELKKIYSEGSNEKFDAIIIEQIVWYGLYPLAAKFNAPIIGVISLGLQLQNYYSLGNPILPSHPSNWELAREHGRKPTLWNRLKNFIETWEYLYCYHNHFLPRQHEIARKYLGNNIPYVGDIEKNFSMTLAYQQAPISFAKPNVPNIIDIGGYLVSKKPQQLSKNLTEFLDGATEGFIYMSLGTNVKTNMMSNEQLEIFLKVFSKLPYKVLWKFDDDELPGKPDNVFISKWVPQQGVLGHPNVKLFIYQGGLQSTEEAVYNAVPLIGIPVYGDQDHQVSKMASLGVARSLEITRLTAKDLDEAIRDVIDDRGYKHRMLELKSLVEDRRHDPLENAVWWIEFVIRHKGAPHLRFSVTDEPWYRRSDMDVVVFLSVIACSLVIVSLVVLFHLMTYGLSLRISIVPGTKKKLH